MLLGFFESGRDAARLRGRHPVRARARARRSAVHLPLRAGARGPARAGAVYRISDLELASRLSFFLWSSIPDDELLGAGGQGPARRARRARAADAAHAGRPAGRRARRQPRRPVAAAAAARRRRAGHEGVRRQPALRVPARDRAAVRNDRPRGPQHPRSVDADYTFVDERLARHYGIPNVRGSRFRRVDARRRRAPRPARSRQPPDRDVGRQPHVAGEARQVDPREPARRAGAVAAAGRRDQPRRSRRRTARRRRRCASGSSSTAPTRAARRATR